MNIQCPNCGEALEFDGEIAEGQHVLCPCCGEKFTYAMAGGLVVRPTAEPLVKKWILPDRKRGAFGFGDFWRALIGRGAWRVVACGRCGRVDVVYSKGKLTFSDEVVCDCGYRINLGESVRFFWSAAAERIRKIELSKIVWTFEDDWNFANDPKTPHRIERVKEYIDRLYKKLGVVNAGTQLLEQRRTTNVILGYANTIGGTVGTYVSIAGAFGEWEARKAETDAIGTANSIMDEIARGEEFVDYYNDLVDEFAGCDKNMAMEKRLMNKVGRWDESLINEILSRNEIVRQERSISVLNGYVSRSMEFSKRSASMGRFGFGLLTLGVTAVVLYVLGVQGFASCIFFIFLSFCLYKLKGKQNAVVYDIRRLVNVCI